jgi:probable F420-dependent oxidoreductase
MQMGRIGIWSSQFWGERTRVMEAAAELEELGYGALWLPNGPGIFERARDLLDATGRVVVATGIASIWDHPAQEAAAAHHALARSHPNRFLLGLGVSHPQIVDREQPGRYRQPQARMQEYLEALDRAPTPVPAGERVLAALGPRMLELARERSAGAHPHLVTADHTRRARRLLGPGRLLAPEQGVVLHTDPAWARGIARRHLAFSLQAPNYTNNWLRLGFTPGDLVDGGSDRLVDALIAWGSADAILSRIAQHHLAGADHVSIQVVAADAATLPRDEWRTLAAMLGLQRAA